MSQQPTTVTGHLYLVATPMGNLADITFRAISILKDVDLIAAEDTRHSKKLLDRYQIKTAMISLHEHNESARISNIITQLKKGKHIALIADAGTPLISDPGYLLVQAAHQAKIKIIPIPGPCAAITGLVASGLPTDHFVFEGFLPPRGSVRKKRLLNLKQEYRTIVFYESVHRIINLIDLMNEVLGGERLATIARELTKTFETIHQDKLSALKIWLHDNPEQQRGEFVVILQGTGKKKGDDVTECRRLLEILLNELTLKQAVQLTKKITGIKRKIIYDLALEIAK